MMRKQWTVVGLALLFGAALAGTPSPAAAELKVSITGQIRFNAFYSDKITDGDQEIAPKKADVPFDSGPSASNERDNGETILDARRTRLQFNISDTVPGDIKLGGVIQTDFSTSEGNALTSNSRGLRVRLAYAQATTPGGFTLRVGQVRTILSEFGDNLIGGVAVPDVINENGHWNQLQAREPGIQLAWSGKAAGGDLTFGAAVEKQAVDVKGRTATSQGPGLANSLALEQGSAQDVPLFGGGIRYRSPLFAVFARGAVAQAKVILETTGDDQDETVWLGAVGAEVTPLPRLTVYGQYQFSNGLNRVNGAFNDVGIVGTVPNVKPEAIEVQGFHAGAQYKVTDDLRLNAVYQWMQADDDPAIFNLTSASTDVETWQAVNVNFLYRFWTRWETGVEYMYGKAEAFGDNEGEINVVNLRLFFYF